MSSVDAGVYVNGDFSEPMHAQHKFQNQFDMGDPLQAMASSRMMHQHTKSQMDLAARSARRRRSDDRGSMSSLTAESSNGSVSSQAS